MAKNQSPKRAQCLQKTRLQKTLLTGAIAAAATLSLWGAAWCRTGLAALQDSPKTIVDEVWQIVNQHYVDGTFNEVDWQATRVSLLDRQYSSQEEAYEAVREALADLNDPYTRFLDPTEYRQLTNKTAGELSGVGMLLKLDTRKRRIVVVEPMENSPASRAGIKAGDEILAIDDRSTIGMNVEEAAKLIRGPVGTQVELKISRPGGDDFDVALTRDRIEVAAVHYTLKEEGARKIGYIQLDEFSSHSAKQMRKAIEELSDRNVDAFVLDLRGNPGGLLYASVEIAKMWVDRGAIVRTVNRKEESHDFEANRTALTKLPLAVLVDGNSASASEILAGALKDNGRATIIGSQTFGKALVQSVHQLSDGSGLAVTIAHYYTPNGTDISQKGITPDITIDLTLEQQQRLSSNPEAIASEEDPFYTQALSSFRAQTPPKPLAVQ